MLISSPDAFKGMWTLTSQKMALTTWRVQPSFLETED